MPDQNQTPEPREWVSTTCTLADGRRVQVEGHIVPLASGERAEALVDSEAVDDFTWRLIRAGMGLLGFDVRGELVSWLDGVLVRQPSSDGGEREALAARITELERLREQDAERADVAWRTMRGERDAAIRERDQAQARSAALGNELAAYRRGDPPPGQFVSIAANRAMAAASSSSPAGGEREALGTALREVLLDTGLLTSDGADLGEGHVLDAIVEQVERRVADATEAALRGQRLDLWRAFGELFRSSPSGWHHENDICGVLSGRIGPAPASSSPPAGREAGCVLVGAAEGRDPTGEELAAQEAAQREAFSGPAGGEGDDERDYRNYRDGVTPSDPPVSSVGKGRTPDIREKLRLEMIAAGVPGDRVDGLLDLASALGRAAREGRDAPAREEWQVVGINHSGARQVLLPPTRSKADARRYLADIKASANVVPAFDCIVLQRREHTVTAWVDVPACEDGGDDAR